jgi:AraC-like DNA-binding protein/tetratricopeptide (TPR) repeat protein
MTPRTNPSTTPPLPHSLRRAVQALRADYARDWSVGELAQAAGVSARTLQRQFRTFLARNPLEELADIRFGRARQSLLRGRPGTKIVAVALACGFNHLGRFAVDYRRRYGEMPSQTLKRQAAFNSLFPAASCLVPSNRDGPTIAVEPVGADWPASIGLAEEVADQVAAALMRAGIHAAGSSSRTRYRLTCAVRGPAERPRLVLRLIERESGRHLWAHHGGEVCESGLAFEEQIATRLVGGLQPSLRQAEIDQAWRKPDDALTATDLALRALPTVLSLNASSNSRALELLDRAMDKDPEHALATALAAWAHAQRVIYHFSSNPAVDRSEGVNLARKALALSKDATLLTIVGTAFSLLDDIPTADQVVRRALSVDGGSAWAWSRRGWIDVYNGDPEAAIDEFKIALDLAPQDDLAFNNLVGLGCAHFRAGRYLEAAQWQQRALAEHPSAVWIHRTLCPAYAIGGAEGEAQLSLTTLRQHYPELTVSQVDCGLPPLPASYRAQVIDTLSSLGLPA